MGLGIASADQGSAASPPAQAAMKSDTPLAALAGQMKAGTWAVLQTRNFDANGLNILVPPIGSSISYITQYSDRGVWDPVSHQFYFCGAAHGEPNQNQSFRKFVKYSESNNSWSTLPDPGFWTAHSYEHLTINPSTGLIYYREYNSLTVDVYDIHTGAWGHIPSIPMGANQVAGALEYFPERNGLVFVDGDWGIWFFGLSSNEWTLVAETNGSQKTTLPKLPMGSYDNFSAYSPAAKAVIFGGGNGSTNVYKMDARGKISTVKNAPFVIGVTMTVVTVDPVSGKILVFTEAQKAYEYDPATDTWTPLNIPAAPFFTVGVDGPVAGTVAAPISNYGVVMFVNYEHSGNSQVYLYKHSASRSGSMDKNVKGSAISSLPPALTTERRP